jgi:hypothetical protein
LAVDRARLGILETQENHLTIDFDILNQPFGSRAAVKNANA